VLGRWMRERGNRDAMFVATKVGFNMPPRVPTSLSRDTILHECETSLRQLQTDRIDLYYAHCDHRDTPLEEVLETFDHMVREGMVRYVGCSNMLAWRIEQARLLSEQHGWPAYCCVQQRHTYLRPKTGMTQFSNGHVPVSGELLDYATRTPTGCASWRTPPCSAVRTHTRRAAFLRGTSRASTTPRTPRPASLRCAR